MNITVYTNPGCMPCRAVKLWLNRNKLEYDEVDISEDAEARDFLISNKQFSTPVTKIEQGNEVVLVEQFNITELESHLLEKACN